MLKFATPPTYAPEKSVLTLGLRCAILSLTPISLLVAFPRRRGEASPSRRGRSGRDAATGRVLRVGRSTTPRARPLDGVPDIQESKEVRSMLGVPNRHSVVLVIDVVEDGVPLRGRVPQEPATGLAKSRDMVTTRAKVTGP